MTVLNVEFKAQCQQNLGNINEKQDISRFHVVLKIVRKNT